MHSKRKCHVYTCCAVKWLARCPPRTQMVWCNCKYCQWKPHHLSRHLLPTLGHQFTLAPVCHYYSIDQVVFFYQQNTSLQTDRDLYLQQLWRQSVPRWLILLVKEIGIASVMPIYCYAPFVIMHQNIYRQSNYLFVSAFVFEQLLQENVVVLQLY